MVLCFHILYVNNVQDALVLGEREIKILITHQFMSSKCLKKGRQAYTEITVTQVFM